MAKKSIIAKLLYQFTGNLRCRIINGNQGEPYLERYHLFRLPGGGGVYIHRFVDSDPDRGLHDHPWKSAVSLILSGSYRELRLQGNGDDKQVVDNLLKPLNLNILHGNDFHRIILRDKKPVWTLFAHSGKYKDWGFLTQNQQGNFSYEPHEAVTIEAEHKLWWKNAPPGKLTARAAL